MEITLFAVALLFVLALAMPSILYPGKRWEHGAVTVTYEAPLSVQGTTTGPTTAQIGNRVNMVSASVVASADGDTALSVTHNLGNNTASLALGDPWVILEPLLSLALTALPMWTVTTKTAIVVTLTKLASTGSGSATPQLRVRVLRPNAGYCE